MHVIHVKYQNVICKLNSFEKRLNEISYFLIPILTYKGPLMNAKSIEIQILSDCNALKKLF